MNKENTATITGNLLQDPKVVNYNGNDFMSLDLAFNPKYQDATGNWVKGEMEKYSVRVPMKNLGQNIVDSGIKKGDPIFAHGKLKEEPWDDPIKGVSGINRNMNAWVIGPDLRYAKATLERQISQAGIDSPEMNLEHNIDAVHSEKTPEVSSPKNTNMTKEHSERVIANDPKLFSQNPTQYNQTQQSRNSTYSR